MRVNTSSWFYITSGHLKVYFYQFLGPGRSCLQRFIDVIVPLMPRVIFAFIGASLARTRPHWHPGWKFGAEELDAGRLGRLRFSLWSVFEERRLRKPFTIRWYDGLRINVYLGNDLSRGRAQDLGTLYYRMLHRCGMRSRDIPCAS